MPFKVLLSQKCESESSVEKHEKTHVQHSVNTPYTYGEEGVKIFEKSLKRDGNFLVKMEGSPYKGVFYRGGASTAFQHMDFVAVMLFTQQVFH